jgi:hypothetical protein
MLMLERFLEWMNITRTLLSPVRRILSTSPSKLPAKMSSDAPGKFVCRLSTTELMAVLVGCIGGSGLYHLDNLTFV